MSAGQPLSSENSEIVEAKKGPGRPPKEDKEIVVKKAVITSQDLFEHQPKKRFFVKDIAGQFGGTKFSDQGVSGEVDADMAELIKKDFPHAIEIDRDGNPIEE